MAFSRKALPFVCPLIPEDVIRSTHFRWLSRPEEHIIALFGNPGLLDYSQVYLDYIGCVQDRLGQNDSILSQFLSLRVTFKSEV